MIQVGSAQSPAQIGPRPAIRHFEYDLLLGALGIFAVVLVLWTLFSGSFLVAAPLPTLGLMAQGLFGTGWMRDHIMATFGPVFIGFGMALVIGVGSGILLGRSAYWRSVFEPILLTLYSVPKIILYPVFLLLFGIGMESRIVMALIHAVFPLLLNSMVGVSTVSATHVKVARMAGANLWQIAGKIYFPSMAPTLVAGVRMGFSLAIIGVVLSELFASREGLGLLIIRSYGVLNIERMFAVILFLFIAALAVNLSLWWLEKRLRGTAR